MKCKLCKSPLNNFTTIMSATADGNLKPLRAYYCTRCQRPIRVEMSSFQHEA